MDGLLRCSRYAFGPNRLHYCGPDANFELLSYIENQESDFGLKRLLIQFETLYPYLKHIATANQIADPFDDRVVEAYWLGNNLLKNISQRSFYNYLLEDLKLKKRLGLKYFSTVVDKIGEGALPHHSFHVLDIWKRTGHLQREHTLSSMDECRISWGKVSRVSGPSVTVETEPLAYEDGQIFLGMPIMKNITRSLESADDIAQVKAGDLITMHWGIPCEVVSASQIKYLRTYTLLHLHLANKTI